VLGCAEFAFLARSFAAKRGTATLLASGYTRLAGASVSASSSQSSSSYARRNRRRLVRLLSASYRLESTTLDFPAASAAPVSLSQCVHSNQSCAVETCCTVATCGSRLCGSHATSDAETSCGVDRDRASMHQPAQHTLHFIFILKIFQ